MIAGIPSILTPASIAMISASDDECDTAPCFLQNQQMGTNVFGPTNTKKHPEVDLESVRSPAKLASENKQSLQSSGRSHTQFAATLSP